MLSGYSAIHGALRVVLAGLVGTESGQDVVAGYCSTLP